MFASGWFDNRTPEQIKEDNERQYSATKAYEQRKKEALDKWTLKYITSEEDIKSLIDDLAEFYVDGY